MLEFGHMEEKIGYNQKSEESDSLFALKKSLIESGAKIGTSEHFVVVFQDKSMYREYGSYLDTDPVSLALFLENGMKRILTAYNFPETNKTQVITVRKRGAKLHDWQARGWYEEGKSSKPNGGVYRNIGFVTVLPGFKKDYLSGSYPPIFATAGHEVLGHGYFQPQLNPDLADQKKRENDYVAVFHEGTSQYIGQWVSGVDSHYAFANWLVDTASGTWWGFPSVSEKNDAGMRKTIEATPDKLYYFFSKIALTTTFLLNDETEFLHTEAGTQRGASFVKFVVDKFGVDVLKQWVGQGNRGNYTKLLEGETGQSIDKIQDQWRSLVLEKMQQTVDLDFNQRKKSKPELARRKSILDMFEKYS